MVILRIQDFSLTLLLNHFYCGQLHQVDARSAKLEDRKTEGKGEDRNRRVFSYLRISSELKRQ